MIHFWLAIIWGMNSNAAFALAFTPLKDLSSNAVMMTHPSSLRGVVVLRSKNSPDDGVGGSDDAADQDGNDSLLDELRRKKNDMFGADIPDPNEELRDAAQNAENAFLAAMLEQTQQFQQIKSEEGSEKACEAFMDRIQEEDEASSRMMSDGDNLVGGDDDGEEDDSIMNKMQDDDNEEIVGLEEIVDDENDNDWQ